MQKFIFIKDRSILEKMELLQFFKSFIMSYVLEIRHLFQRSFYFRTNGTFTFFNHSEPDIRHREALEKELSRSCAISNFGWLVSWLRHQTLLLFLSHEKKGWGSEGRISQDRIKRSKVFFSRDRIFWLPFAIFDVDPKIRRSRVKKTFKYFLSSDQFTKVKILLIFWSACHFLTLIQRSKF